MSLPPGCFCLSHFSLSTAPHSNIKGPLSQRPFSLSSPWVLGSPSASSAGICKEIISAASFCISHLCTGTRSEGSQLLSAAAAHWAFAYSMASVSTLVRGPSGSGGKPGNM